MTRPAFLDHPGPIALAHRGGGDPGRENTWHAFGEAVGLGYRYLETDAWATRDGQVVLFHDDDLGRVSDTTGSILSKTAEQVARVRVAGSETIPRLEDVLGAWPDVRLNVDLKCDEVVEPFVEAVKRTSAYDRVCVASFEERRIRKAVDLLGRRVCVSAGRSMIVRLRLLSFATGATQAIRTMRTRPDVVQVPLRAGAVRIVTPAFVRRLHAWGIDVHCWTINDAATMESLLDLGVDGLISDTTTELKAVLERRGQWPT